LIQFLTNYNKIFNRHAFDEKYKNTFRNPAKQRDYFQNKKPELEEYRSKWTKREQSFDTTYKSDILKNTAQKSILK
jgi:hypothetical protein